MFKRLSSVTFKNHSDQPSEEDELDPTSRLDSTCLIFVQLSGTGIVKISVWNDWCENSNLYAEKEICCEPIRSMK